VTVIVVAELSCAVIAGPRPSAIVRARGSSGAIGLGEATPLPGRSPDRADDTARAVAALARALPLTLPLRHTLDAAAELAASAAPTSPAARFAIETALLDLAARTTGRSLGRLLAARPALAVPLNALVASTADALDAVARGIACLKIKAHGSWDVDRRRIESMRDAAPDAALRVDANQSWPDAEVVMRLAAIAELDIEYVEEPSLELARRLRAPLPCPVALDESLVDAEVDAWLGAALASGAIAALVLKPPLLGGLARCLELAARGRAAGVDAVVTHSFDGPIATAAACELALALAPRRAVGLDRHVGLAPWAGVDVPHLASSVVIDQRRPGIGIDPVAVDRALRALAQEDDLGWLADDRGPADDGDDDGRSDRDDGRRRDADATEPGTRRS
jgi:L-alanine-DL-glutamate epimerase-like enolase superfamily enzyme